MTLIRHFCDNLGRFADKRAMTLDGFSGIFHNFIRFNIHILSDRNPVSYTPPQILMESSWSPGGVDWRWILDLAKFKESPSGVLVDSM